jgi:putative transposase
MNIHKSYFYYNAKKDDLEVETAIRAKANDCFDGFWKIFHRLRNDGHVWNHKRVYRVYKTLKLNKRVPLRKRLPARVKNPLITPSSENITWSMDFVTDVLQSNRKFRVLNIIDDYDRVIVGQKVAPSMPAERVIRFLEEIIWENGKPNNIRCDNGPEFISHKFQDWCKGNNIKIMYTQPGCPTQNSYIERFNGSYRRAVLDAYIFKTLDEVRELTEEWIKYYNNERPHDALNHKAPMQYRLAKTG